MSSVKTVLVLEDGAVFEGLPFGKVGEAIGEAVFYTGVVGYQELITNPSYRGTLAVLTYPIIGTYGVNREDDESPAAHVGGLIIREYSPYYSNWRATGPLEGLLEDRGIVGIREIDTRALTVHLRDHGEMRGIISSKEPDPKRLAQKLKAAPSPCEQDLAGQTTWEGLRQAAGQEKCRVAVLNLGVKNSLLAQLTALGCTVDVLPCTASAADILAKKPRGVLVAGGPGDPRLADYAVRTVKALLGKAPLLGIGLGHQVLALALGGKVARMKVGHRGVNHPVKNLVDGRAQITVQHHSFAVDESALPKSAEVTHKSLNDGTVEGIRSKEAAAASVQFHPCPDEMERPHELLRKFCQID